MRAVLPAGINPNQTFHPIRKIDYLALRLLSQRSVDGSQLKKEQHIRKLDKAFREGKLGYPQETPPDWQWRMCEARLLLGDYSDWSGWEYRSDWSAGMWHNAGEWRTTSNGKVKQTPAWQGQRVEVLHVLGEQGVGDEVCFAQVLEDVKPLVGEIVLETDERLCKVFERDFGIKCIPSYKKDGERYYRSSGYPWIPLGELLRNYRRHSSKFKRKPYLTALPVEVEKWKSLKGRTGISWRGAQGSYSLQEMALVKEPLGLQYDLAWDEEVERPEIDLRNDLEGILGILSNLDRLVTVSTSIAHFAAALGVKTDVILAPLNGVRQNILPFKWGMGGKSQWYGDHVTVYPNMKAYLARI